MVMRKMAFVATSITLLATLSTPAFAKEGGIHGNWKHVNWNNSTNVKINFQDVNGNYSWATKAIDALASQGAIQGMYNNGKLNFQPGGQLTRAQFAALLTRFFELQAPSTVQEFNDVSPTSWYYNDVEAAAGYMTKFTASNGGYNFMPNAIMNRAETAVSLVQVLLNENAIQLVSADQANQILSNYVDANQIPTTLRVYVATAIQNQLMRGVGNNKFDPLGKLNRAQAAQLLYNLESQTEVPPSGTSTSTTGTEVPPSGTTTSTAVTGGLSAPSSETTGTIANYTFTVYQNGNVDTAINGYYDVTASSSTGSATVTSPVLFTNGTATVPIVLNTAGSQTVTVTIPTLGVSAQTSIAPVNSTISAQLSAPSSLITTGTAANYTFTVYQNGVALNGTYDVTVSTTTGSATVESPVPFTNGVATVPITLSTAGTQTVTISVPSIANASAQATVTPVTLTGQLGTSTLPTHGTVNNYTLTVYENGSVYTALNGSYDVTVATSATSGATISTPVTFTNGVATLPITLNAAGTQTVTVTVPQLNNFSVSTSVNAQ
jgi:S-layer homology domain